jgi:hypothetical protein
MEGNAVKDKHGNEVSLDRASLDEYLLYNPLFLDNEQTYLSNNLGSLLVGIDTAAHFPTKDFNTYLENLPYKVAGNQLPNETLKVTRKAERLFRKMYSEAQRVKGWADPLTSDEILDIQYEFLDKLEGMNLNTIPTSEVNLDGTTNPDPSTPDPSTPDPSTPDPSTPDPITSKPNQAQLDWFESNKNDPKAVEDWKKAGFEVPEEEMTEAEIEAARLAEEEAAAVAEAQRQEEIDNLVPTLEEAGYDLESAREALTYMVEAELDPSNTQNKRSKRYKEYWHTFNKLSETQIGALMQPIIDEAMPLIEQQIEYNDRGGWLGKRANKKIKSLLKEMKSDPRVILSEELLEAVEEVRNR